MGRKRHSAPRRRAALFDLLENHGTQSFVKIKQHLGLPRTAQFNLERGKAKELKGNATAAVHAKGLWRPLEGVFRG